MNKARERVKREFEAEEGLSTHSDPRWYWRLRTRMEIVQYWVMVVGFPLAILLWIVTGDFWKALAFYAVCQIYNMSQNMRGLMLHAEHLIEWTIKKSV